MNSRVRSRRSPSNKRSFWIPVLLGLLGCFLALGYAAIGHRPAAEEGSFWFYSVISGEHLFSPIYQTRYFDVVWQLPALIYLKWFRGENARTALYLLDFAYTFHPLLSLVACYGILRKRRREGLLIFPIFSFCIATMPTMFFAVGMVQDALTLFWPLFFLLLFRSGKSWEEAIPIGILICALGITYEPACFMLVFLAAIAAFRAFRIHRSGSPADRLPLLMDCAFAALCILACARTLYVIPPSNPPGEFFQDLMFPLDTGRYFSLMNLFIFSLGTALAVLGRRQLLRKKTLFSLFLFSFWIFLAWLDFRLESSGRLPGLDKHYARLARTTAIPVAIAIAGICVLMCARWRSFLALFHQMSLHLSLYLGFLLLVAALIDVSYTTEWNQSVRYFRKLTQDQTGCLYMPGRAKPMHFTFFTWWGSMADFSILV